MFRVSLENATRCGGSEAGWVRGFLLHRMRNWAFSGKPNATCFLALGGPNGMATRTRAHIDNQSTSVTARPLASSHLEELVRLILAKTKSANQASDEKGHPSEQIILDIHLDGARYLLVRMPKQSHMPLSPRELEIVRMVAQGHPNKIIADVLSISSWTVCTHVRRIFAKLGVGSRAAMVARLLECGALSERVRTGNEERFELNLPSIRASSEFRSRTATESINTAGRPVQRAVYR
jgi:DNA-binding CsgD family transcriptional regulator